MLRFGVHLTGARGEGDRLVQLHRPGHRDPGRLARIRPRGHGRAPPRSTCANTRATCSPATGSKSLRVRAYIKDAGPLGPAGGRDLIVQSWASLPLSSPVRPPLLVVQGHVGLLLQHVGLVRLAVAHPPQRAARLARPAANCCSSASASGTSTPGAARLAGGGDAGRIEQRLLLGAVGVGHVARDAGIAHVVLPRPAVRVAAHPAVRDADQAGRAAEPGDRRPPGSTMGGDGGGRGLPVRAAADPAGHVPVRSGDDVEPAGGYRRLGAARLQLHADGTRKVILRRRARLSYLPLPAGDLAGRRSVKAAVWACGIGSAVRSWSGSWSGALPSEGLPGAHADLCDLAAGRVLWPRSGCRMAKDPGAKLVAA